MEPVFAKIDQSGRVVIPAAYRRELGIEAGDRVMIELDSRELRIMSHAEAIRSAQEIVARYIPKGRSLADELIAERRGEAARE